MFTIPTMEDDTLYGFIDRPHDWTIREHAGVSNLDILYELVDAHVEPDICITSANLTVVACGKTQLSVMDSSTTIVTGDILFFLALLPCKHFRYIVVALGSATIQAMASKKPCSHYSPVVQASISTAVPSNLETLGFG